MKILDHPARAESLFRLKILHGGTLPGWVANKSDYWIKAACRLLESGRPLLLQSHGVVMPFMNELRVVSSSWVERLFEELERKSEMNPNEYQQLAMRTKADPAKILGRLAIGDPKWMQMIVAFMGLVDEIGEVAGPLKKKIEYNGAEPDPVNMKEEIGDMLWRIAQLADALGLKLEDCMTANIAKLAKRYPSHYSDQQALNRDLTEERKALGPDEAFSMLFESAKEVQSESPEKLWFHGVPTIAGRYEGKCNLHEASYTFTIDFDPTVKPWPGELPFYRRIG